MTVLTSVVFFLVAYVVGSLPLGSRLVRAATGYRPREMSADNLGLENLWHFVGLWVALAAFALDILKGFLTLAFMGASAWAALGVYMGHLYPLPLLNRDEIPRGRGKALLLGVLLGFVAFGALSGLYMLVPLGVYGVILALFRYPSLAGLGAVLTMPMLMLAADSSTEAFVLTFFITVLALWRHKVSVARYFDGTEPRLGEPPSVRGADPSVVCAAFMIHPMTVEDFYQPPSLRWLKTLVERGWVTPAMLRRAALFMRAQKQGEIRGIRLRDGRELRMMLISGPLFPDQIRRYPEKATQIAVQGARLAKELGAEAFGLGAFWSTVGNKGLEVQEAVPEINITNGGAYTAATVKAAVPGLLKRFEREGGSLKRACAAVVGANGVVAFGVARMVVGEVGALILIGRDPERLERSAATLRRKHPDTEITVATDVSACCAADLVFTATSDPNPVLFPEHVKPGAWIFDLGRPADADERVREVPGVHLVPGGVVRPPGEMLTLLDMHFGDGNIPACMAETMIMTATRAWERKSLGAQTRTADIDYYLEQGALLGFEIITRDARVVRIEEVV